MSDYLSILNAAIFTDLLFLFIVIYTNLIKSNSLKEWYHKYGLSAIIADVLIIVIGVIITKYIYPMFFKSFSIIRFTCLAVIVQLIHDICFYKLFTLIPRGTNKMLDHFKLYAKEMGASALLGDSLMIALTCFVSSFLTYQSLNTNILILIGLVYILPYLLYA
jgi:uncharacterized protein YacL